MRFRGELLGWISFVLFVMIMVRIIIKRFWHPKTNMELRNKIIRFDAVHHKHMGIFVILVTLAHGFLMTCYYHFSVDGFMAFLVMALLVIGGLSRNSWLYKSSPSKYFIHFYLSLLATIIILIHVFV